MMKDSKVNRAGVVSVILIFLFINTGFSQNDPLGDLKWKQRVLLLLSDSESNVLYQQQLAELEKLDSEFDVRKLLVIDVRKDKYRIRNDANTKWRSDDYLYARYNPNEESFYVVLIGLDGGVKLRQIPLIKRQELFDRIDAMPMRSSEIRNKY